MNSMPVEITKEIMSYMEPQDLINLKKTSRRFYNVYEIYINSMKKFNIQSIAYKKENDEGIITTCYTDGKNETFERSIIFNEVSLNDLLKISKYNDLENLNVDIFKNEDTFLRTMNGRESGQIKGTMLTIKMENIEWTSMLNDFMKTYLKSFDIINITEYVSNKNM
uniref:F-box domain-containing protein n=1 Tax=Parastrongyloides trichosuri TaxID=131310 RepID=A0A0N4ZTW7_PARTI